MIRDSLLGDIRLTRGVGGGGVWIIWFDKERHVPEQVSCLSLGIRGEVPGRGGLSPARGDTPLQGDKTVKIHKT